MVQRGPGAPVEKDGPTSSESLITMATSSPLSCRAVWAHCGETLNFRVDFMWKSASFDMLQSVENICCGRNLQGQATFTVNC